MNDCKVYQAESKREIPLFTCRYVVGSAETRLRLIEPPEFEQDDSSKSEHPEHIPGAFDSDKQPLRFVASAQCVVKPSCGM